MKHPPYHMRSNKAVDRYLFVEVLRRVFQTGADSRRYTYVGFGGPFLEDLKVIEHYFPEMRFVSLEEDGETFKRQQKHRFNRRIKLQLTPAEDYVRDMTDDMLVALWFDYLGREAKDLADFSDALTKAAPWSVLRITFNSTFKPDTKFRTAFEDEFKPHLPAEDELPQYFTDQDAFDRLLLKVVERATLAPIGANYDFKLLNSATYKDGVRMLTVTGIKAPAADWPKLRERFSRWPFASHDWNAAPTMISVPELSMQERLRLAGALPSRVENVGARLQRRLGYLVANTEASTATELTNYASFCRYFPIFAKLEM